MDGVLKYLSIWVYVKFYQILLGMTNMAISRRDIYWGYAAQLLNVGAGLILLPVVVRYFSPEDVGLWFVFITLAGLAQLLEFGFQPTLARNTAYVYAGARS